MNWHRLFGLILADYFRGTSFEVEIEKDLSIRKQLLDVVVIRKTQGMSHLPLPDGMGDLVDHNLISFKSYREPLNAWAVKELMGHYVNYRKQVSPSLDDLLPEELFRCFGVAARFPEQLHREHPLEQLSAGVYNCHWGTDDVRIIVPGELPHEEQNALLHLFSADPQRIQFGTEHYQKKSDDTSTLIEKLISHHRGEGLNVSYTIEDFRREYWEEVFSELAPEERLKIAKLLSTEEFAKAHAKINRLKEEMLKALSKEEILKTLSKEEILEHLKKLEEADSASNGQ